MASVVQGAAVRRHAFEKPASEKSGSDNHTTAARVPSFGTTTRLFARALGCSPEILLQAFRPARADDLQAVLAFRNRRHWDDAAYVRWRYGLTEQPHSHGRLWILRLYDGPVLAAIGSEVQPVRHAGMLHQGQLLMDLQLAPGLEGAGGGAWMNQAMFRQAPATLAVGANELSIGLVRRLYAPLPARTYQVLPLDAGRFLRQRGVPASAAAVAGLVMDTGLWIRGRMFAPRTPMDIRVDETTSVDAGWLDLLYAALPERLTSITPSAKHLQWRLFDNPRARYRLYRAHQDDRCIGYLAARRTQGGGSGGDALHILDWKLAAGAEAPALTALLQHAVGMARQQDCSKVYTTALAPGVASVFRRLGFLRGRADARLLTGLHMPSLPTDTERASLLHASGWQITDLSFDSDGCF